MIRILDEIIHTYFLKITINNITTFIILNMSLFNLYFLRLNDDRYNYYITPNDYNLLKSPSTFMKLDRIDSVWIGGYPEFAYIKIVIDSISDIVIDLRDYGFNDDFKYSTLEQTDIDMYIRKIDDTEYYELDLNNKAEEDTWFYYNETENLVSYNYAIKIKNCPNLEKVLVPVLPFVINNDDSVLRTMEQIYDFTRPIFNYGKVMRY